MWEIVPWIVSRPWKSNVVQKISKTFRRLLLRTQRRLKAGECRRRCTASSLSPFLPNVCLLLSTLHSVLPPKGVLHPRRISRGACFELLINEADPVAGPRTTKVSETPLKLKNAPLLKCCQPACLNHLSALNAQELFSTDLMQPLLNCLKRMHEACTRSNGRKYSASQFSE